MLPQNARIIRGSKRSETITEGRMVLIRQPWEPKGLQFDQYGSVAEEDVRAENEKRLAYQRDQMARYDAMERAGRGAGDRRPGRR
jgi:hypothetical protein